MHPAHTASSGLRGGRGTWPVVVSSPRPSGPPEAHEPLAAGGCTVVRCMVVLLPPDRHNRAMPTLADLTHCAAGHLTDYTNPTGTRAFSSYDRQGDSKVLEPVDFFAPALLDAPVRGQHVRNMYLPSGAYRDLRNAMDRLLADEAASTAEFKNQDVTADTGPWSLVNIALVASNRTPGIKASKVTKILHRKRPALVPIFDSRVAAFYGLSPRKPWDFWPAIQGELRQHGEWLRQLTKDTLTPDGRSLTDLRTLDIIVWEHATSGCTELSWPGTVEQV